MPPPANLVNAVHNAADTLVIRAGARLGTANRTWPFLSPSSSIIERKALGFLNNLYPNTTLLPTQVDEVADYLALSTCCHVLDGWRYLSRAAISLLNGGRNEALHMAYYAELRAALSILAGSGIGILKDRHFSLESTGVVNWFKGSTHERAWEALQEWASIRSNALRVVDCFSAFDIEGREWAEACGAATTTHDVIAENWLQNWSVDIRLLTQDRTSRNEASYRPDLHWKALTPLSSKELKFIRDVNAACMSAGYGRFESLDTALIYNLCESACKLLYITVSEANMKLIWMDVLRWLVHPSKGFDKNEALHVISNMRKVPDSAGQQVLEHSAPSNSECTGVFSRALLLLRLASALHRKQWEQIQIYTPRGIADWQKVLLTNYGEHAQLWDSLAPPINFDQLDDELNDAQDSIQGWCRGNPGLNPYLLWKAESSSLLQLCRLERIAILAANV